MPDKAGLVSFQKNPKAYTTTTERKSFGGLFWTKRKTFQAGPSSALISEDVN